MTIKQKTINGLIWSFIGNFSNQGVQFIIGLVLARLLAPREFGIIGMITIFIALSESFIDSGFNSALIRKKNCTQNDYSTIFFFNLAVSIFFVIVLILSAGAISRFFDVPILKPILQVLSLGLIFSSLSLIQQTILIKKIDFKLQTKISVISALTSGLIGIGMAYSGYGVWSLVARTLSGYIFTTLLLWLWNNWKPTITFNIQAFKELFGFGSKLLISGLIDTAYNNIYYLIIGKYFSPQELGFYTRADQFRKLPSQNITGIVHQVSYPVLATMTDDPVKLKAAYKKMIRSTIFITSILMLGLAAIAKPMILTTIGEKWLPTVIYLQMLCFIGMFYPLHAMNLSMLNIQGRSDLFLRLEIIKKTLAVPTIIVGIFFGIKIMILGMFFNTLIAYYLNSYYSGKMIDYSIKEQIFDISPSILLAVFMGLVVFIIGLIMNAAPIWILTVQLIIGASITFIISELFQLNDYLYIKQIVLEKYTDLKNK